MLRFRGGSRMRLYMPVKLHKLGFIFYYLVESNNSYYYNLIFPPGKLYKQLIAPELGGLFNFIHSLIYYSIHNPIQTF